MYSLKVFFATANLWCDLITGPVTLALPSIGKQKNKTTKQGIQIMSAALCVWKQELKPFLTTVNKKEIDENNKGLTRQLFSGRVSSILISIRH